MGFSHNDQLWVGLPSPDTRQDFDCDDIFHSSPILVTPPPPQYLCDLGVSSQCVATLYSSLTPNSGAAYEAYRTAQSARAQFDELHSDGDRLG